MCVFLFLTVYCGIWDRPLHCGICEIDLLCVFWANKENLRQKHYPINPTKLIYGNFHDVPFYPIAGSHLCVGQIRCPYGVLVTLAVDQNSTLSVIGDKPIMEKIIPNHIAGFSVCNTAWFMPEREQLDP